MRADCTPTELALLQGTAFTPHIRAFVADADGTWRNLADLDGISHLRDLVVDIDIDNKVGGFEIHFRRDTGATRSLSPLRTDSVLNRNAAAEFAPLLAAGRDVYAQVAATAPGVEPIETDWHTIAVGIADRVEYGRAIGVLQCRDELALLADRYNIREYTNNYTYAGSGTPVPLATEIENALSLLGDEAPPLRVIGEPSYLINHFTGDVEPILDIVLRLAQLPGWDFRSLWHNAAGRFQPTLYDPQRTKTIPDLVLDPDQYIDVEELADDATNVRNEILIRYGPANHISRGVPLAVQDMGSISRYRRKTLVFTEATNSPIDLQPEAQAMIEYALSDLKEPDAELQLEMLPFWPVELHDLVRCTANGVHFDTDVDLAVTKIRHRFGGDRPRTTLSLRGTPAAYYRGWIRRAKVPIQPRSDEQADVDDFLSNLRITRISATQAEITATLASRVNVVFVYAQVLTATAAFPEPTEAPGFVKNIDDTFTLVVDLPARGQRTYVQLEPRDSDHQVLGGVRRLALDPFGDVVGLTYLAEEPTAGTGRVTIGLTDAGGFVHPSTKVQFRKTHLGVMTVEAATSAPPGTTTTGTYVYDLTLDAKHPIRVEAEWVDTGGTAHPIGSWTFDRDKNANVINLAVAPSAASARATAVFDTDAAIGADNAQYAIDDATFASPVNLTIVADASATIAGLTLTALPQKLYVRARNAAGAWGPAVVAELPAAGGTGTAPLIYGLSLNEHEHAPGVWDLQVGFAQRGAIAYTKVTWWLSWPDSETPTTLAAGVNEFDLYPTYTIDPAGSEQATVNIYVTGYDTDDLPVVESRVVSRVIAVNP